MLSMTASPPPVAQASRGVCTYASRGGRTRIGRARARIAQSSRAALKTCDLDHIKACNIPFFRWWTWLLKSTGGDRFRPEVNPESKKSIMRGWCCSGRPERVSQRSNGERDHETWTFKQWCWRRRAIHHQHSRRYQYFIQQNCSHQPNWGWIQL